MMNEDKKGCLIITIVIIGVAILVSLTTNMDFKTWLMTKRIIGISSFGLGGLSWLLYNNISENIRCKYKDRINEAKSKNEDVKAGILEYERDKKLNLIRILGRICLILAVIGYFTVNAIAEYD